MSNPRKKRQRLGSVSSTGGSRKGRLNGGSGVDSSSGGAQFAAEVNAKDMGTSMSPERVFSTPFREKESRK